MSDNYFSTHAEREAAKAVSFAEFGNFNLASIRTNIQEVLKLIGRNGIFDEYTLHDISHIDELLKLLDLVIPAETASLLTSGDWLIIVLACYFHDMGLLVTTHEFEHRDESGFPQFKKDVLLAGDQGVDYEAKLAGLDEEEREHFYYQEFVRIHHAERIYNWVSGQAVKSLGVTNDTVDALSELLNGLSTKFREDLALICRSHHSNDLDNINTYPIKRAYGPTLRHPVEALMQMIYCVNYNCLRRTDMGLKLIVHELQRKKSNYSKLFTNSSTLSAC